MSRLPLLALGILVLLGIGVAAMTLPAQGSKEIGPPEPLSDKPVLVLSKRDSEVTLEQVRLRNFGGRQFVVGKEMKDSMYTKARFKGGIIWIPLDDVTQLVELTDAKGGK